MQPRTLTAMLLAMLVVLPATVLAEENSTTALRSEPTFGIGVERDGLRLAPGQSASLHVYAKSRVEQAITFAVEAPDGLGVVPQNDAEKAWPAGHAGLAATIEPATVKAGPDSRGDAKLTLAAREGAAFREPVPVVIIATNDAGERHALRILVGVGPKESPVGFVLRAEAAVSGGPRLLGAVLRNDAEPDALRIHPGGEGKFHIIAKARNATTLALSYHIRGEGYRVELRNETLDVPAGGRAATTLVVHAAKENASRFAGIEVVATDAATGERHAVQLKVGLTPHKSDERPCAASAATREPTAAEKDRAIYERCLKPKPAAAPRDVFVDLDPRDLDGAGVRVHVRVGGLRLFSLLMDHEMLARFKLAEHPATKG